MKMKRMATRTQTMYNHDCLLRLIILRLTSPQSTTRTLHSFYRIQHLSAVLKSIALHAICPEAADLLKRASPDDQVVQARS